MAAAGRGGDKVHARMNAEQPAGKRRRRAAGISRLVARGQKPRMEADPRAGGRVPHTRRACHMSAAQRSIRTYHGHTRWLCPGGRLAHACLPTRCATPAMRYARDAPHLSAQQTLATTLLLRLEQSAARWAQRHTPPRRSRLFWGHVRGTVVVPVEVAVAAGRLSPAARIGWQPTPTYCTGSDVELGCC